MNALPATVERLLRFPARFRRQGLRSILRGGVVRLAAWAGRDWSDPYRDWIEDQTPSRDELARQRAWRPGSPQRIGLVLWPSGDATATEASLKRQTYPHWHWIEPADCAETFRPPCDYVGVVGAGDLLEPDALYHFAAAIVAGDPRPDALYCDEDHLAADGRSRLEPIFKPSWSPEMLLGDHYTGRLTLIRSNLLAEIGGLDLTLGAAAEWDLMLRLSTRTDRVVRIPRCLYHNRRDRMPGDPDGLRRRVLEAHLGRLGLPGASAKERPNGAFRVAWDLGDPPRVSVVIPTVNSPGLIDRCVRGLVEETAYPNKEILLVDSGSTNSETLALYDHWIASGVVRVIPLERRPFNYSAACNRGAAEARGDYLLFLNNDIEVIAPDWIAELVRWASRPGIGVVGTELLFPDGTVQHAGIILSGWSILVDHLHVNRRPEELVGLSPFGRLRQYRNPLAVTGACQMIARPTFEAIGGFDERYRLLYSDTELCLRARAAGYRTVYTPDAALVHHEGKTRGHNEPPEDIERFVADLDRAAIAEDPYFHPELAMIAARLVLRPSWCEPAGIRIARRLREANRLNNEERPAP